VATPRLNASAILLTGDESVGVNILGIDPASEANALYRQELLSGAWLQADDREGVLVGAPLARKRHLSAGDEINLLVNTSNGEISEQRFVVRGVYTTHTPTYDQRTVLMPLAKAQAITQAGDRASAVWVLLDDMDDSQAVAAALTSDRYTVETWQKMNAFYLSMEDYSNAIMWVFYLIVLAITATVVVNAMVMAVFERTREIGILAAIGMRAPRILTLFLAESFLLATGGVFLGLVLGGLLVFYLTRYGIYLGNLMADMGVTGFTLGDRLYGILTPHDAIILIVAAFGVTLVASLYPALLAARMEPVQALHGGEA
jgi:ABC-type lipoprotein release transport system permease subunit